MAPKSKVSETGDVGHGVTFEVRPAKAGKPTVHVVIDGSRLPAFRLKDGSSATEQVRRLQQVDDHLARLTSGAPIDAGQPSGMAMDAMQGSQPAQPTHAATDAAQQEPPPPPHGCRREFQALARATAAAGCMVLPQTAAWAASESLPPPLRGRLRIGPTAQTAERVDASRFTPQWGTIEYVPRVTYAS